MPIKKLLTEAHIVITAIISNLHYQFLSSHTQKIPNVRSILSLLFYKVSVLKVSNESTYSGASF